MTHFIGIGGQPGSGKTTLMCRILAEFDFAKWTSFREGLMVGHKNTRQSIAVLGRYEAGLGPFKGTDRLSMGVMGDFDNWGARLEMMGNAVVLFEGDRLCNQRFLSWTSTLDGSGLSMYWLNTPDEVAAARRADRGPQSASWVAGRITKSNNLASQYGLAANEETVFNVIVERLKKHEYMYG